ncbi:DUF4253 domain-containing protein [Hymenobacter sp. BT523]|uniref:DUF4253 domain-containing protein n=1 Tax=Hymenobacter sp. BT523 TaxID=2795725 RepID=UPI0018EC75FB|nr:DUF4253 domain-containing protein [Hymenobacter sp. BT523]MBJ6110161.1 DUF4253 domain-containing protein [Hymenobacter sp. BT523]
MMGRLLTLLAVFGVLAALGLLVVRSCSFMAAPFMLADMSGPNGFKIEQIDFDDYLKRHKTEASVYELALKTNILPSAIRQLEQACGSPAQRLTTFYTYTVFSGEVATNGQDELFLSGLNGHDSVELPGVCAPAHKSSCWQVVEALNRDSLLTRQDYVAYTVEDGKNPLRVALIHSDNRFAPLLFQQTNGVNFGITTDSLVTEFRRLDALYGVEIVGAGFDQCTIRFKSLPDNKLPLAARLERICPSEQEEPVNLKALAAEIQVGKNYSFWWD